MEVKGTSGRSFCCESKGQFKSCLKRHTPSLLLPSSWKGNLGSCLMAEALHRMSPTPTSCPLPLPLCRMSGVLCSKNLFTFKFYLLQLDSGASAEPGHSLGPILDFSHCGNCQTAVVSAQPEGMASNGAYPVLGPGVTVNPGTSLSVFIALPFTTPAHGPAHGPLLVTAGVPPGGPLVLSAFPSTPLVAEQDGRGPSGAGASNVFVQMRTEVGPVKAAQAQTLVLTQAPLIWQAPGTLCGGVVCPPPLLLAAAPVVPVMAAQVVGGTQACEGGCCPPLVSQGNAGPRPQGAHGEGSPWLPPRPRPRPDDSCNPKSVYENFRLWQHYKSLAQRHLPHSPDTEALSCSSWPSRNLAHARSSPEVQLAQWCTAWASFTPRFLEFEAEEEMQIQKSQWMKGPQCLPPPATPRLEPRGPPAPEVVKQEATVPTPHASLQEGDLLPPTGQFPGLCSQKDFIAKVEAVIHPRFLEELFSPDPQMDFLALSQELEQEEGLTLAQVPQGQEGPGPTRCPAEPHPLSLT
uniref:Nuclear Testis protein N-terminal domain-containing protein n=1 Tax=Pan paniscus TaxID=9597 RepID=A0A2R9A1Z0_PANPA